MNIYDRLLQDHKELRDLFSVLARPHELQAFGREPFLRDVRLKLVAHDRAEESTFYDAIGNDPNLRGLVVDGRLDHQEITKLLNGIDSLPIEGQEWFGRMCAIRDKFLRHAEEEETEMFPRAQKVLGEDRAERIGEQFQEAELRLLVGARGS